MYCSADTIISICRYNVGCVDDIDGLYFYVKDEREHLFEVVDNKKMEILPLSGSAILYCCESIYIYHMSPAKMFCRLLCVC